MKRVPFGVAVAGLSIMLAGCGQEAEDASAPAVADGSGAAASSSEAMGNMAMPAEGKAAKGSGTVTALDAGAGKITLDHGPIVEAGWPAMTMAFDAEPAVLQGIAVGDKVDFDVMVKGGAGEITALRKR